MNAPETLTAEQARDLMEADMKLTLQEREAKHIAALERMGYKVGPLPEMPKGNGLSLPPPPQAKKRSVIEMFGLEPVEGKD